MNLVKGKTIKAIPNESYKPLQRLQYKAGG